MNCVCIESTEENCDSVKDFFDSIDVDYSSLELDSFSTAQTAKVSILEAPIGSARLLDHINKCESEAVPHACRPLIDPVIELEWLKQSAAGSTEVKTDPQPDRPFDADFLSVDDIAQLLCCSTRTVQNIPNDQLTRHPGPGRGNIYLREDVKNYLHKRLVKIQVTDKVIMKALHLPVDRRRKRSRKGERSE